MSSPLPNRARPPVERVLSFEEGGASRLGLAPFRSLSALSRPARTAERVIRVLVNGAGCTFARCELRGLNVRVEKTTGHPEAGVRRVVEIPGQNGSEGRIEIHAASVLATALEPDLLFMAQTLGTLVALHRNPGVRNGIVMSAGNVHLLANIVNSLRMQLLVTVAYRDKGRADEVGPFLERALAQCERLDKFIFGLRRR